MNMKKWLSELKNERKPLPVLSFPSATLLGMNVSELISSSENQAKGMKAISDRCDSAASVSFMDLSVEAECFGANVVFSDDEVPTITGRLIETEEDADNLKVPEVGSKRSKIYIDAIKEAKKMITDRPVLAGVIGPFSLAARLIDVTEIMMECYDNPEMVETVLSKATEFLINYCLAYKEAGANGIVMAEPVSGLLSPSLEEEFSMPYVKKIVDAVQDDEFIVIYHNCGDNTPMMTDSFIENGAAAYHFGNSIDMEEMIKKFPGNVPVMGNVDPAGEFFGGTKDSIKAATKALLEKCGDYDNFVLSSGCDIPPHSLWENIDAFFEASREYYGK